MSQNLMQNLADVLSEGKQKDIGSRELQVESIAFSGVKNLRDSVLHRECKGLEQVENVSSFEKQLFTCLQNLQDLNVIDSTTVEVSDGETPTGARVHFHMKESRNFRISLQGGLENKSKPVGSAGFDFVNYFGWAERFSLQAGSTIKFSDPEFDASLTLPHVGINNGTVHARLFNSRHQYEEMSNVKEVKSGIRFVHEFGPTTSVIFNSFFRSMKDYDNVSSNTSNTVIAACGESTVTSCTLRQVFPFVDNEVIPTRGAIVATSNEVGLPPGDTHFWKNKTSASAYIPLGRFFTIALTGYAGLALPILGASTVALPERFFPALVRGYEGVFWGPQEEDDYVGGNALLGGSASLRFPIAPSLNIYGHIFANAANVTNMTASEVLDRAKITNMVQNSVASTGIGFVLATGMGVLELNFNHLLRGQDHRFKPWQFHFSFSPKRFV